MKCNRWAVLILLSFIYSQSFAQNSLNNETTTELSNASFIASYNGSNKVEDTTNSSTTLREDIASSLNAAMNVSTVTFADTNISEIVTESTTQAESTTPDVLKKWQRFETVTKLFAKQSVKALIPALTRGSEDLKVSDQCQKQVFKLLIGLSNIKTWAFSCVFEELVKSTTEIKLSKIETKQAKKLKLLNFTFIDASAKIIDGMLTGTLSNLGEYDQCINIKATDDRRGRNFGKVMFTGQYCALDIRPPLPPKKMYYKLNDVVDVLKNFSQGDNVINEAAKSSQFFNFLAMRYGICVPSGCTAEDIQGLLNKVEEDTALSIKVRRCELKEENKYTPLIIGVMTAMSFFGFLMLVGSLIELYHYYAQKKIKNLGLQILVCFSLISNFKKLVNTKTSSGKMSCLHGFRFLSISWIILGHTYLNINFQLFRGLQNIISYPKDIAFQAVINATVAVDTFFFIGGFLVCYATMKVLKKTGRSLNIPVYILHRVFRILPIYMVVVSFIYLAPIMGGGPVWHDTIDKFVESCYRNWWTNFLFINNFVNANDICLPQSWYIACDMQLYVAALIFLIPLIRYPKVSLSIASLGIVASVIGNIFLTYVNNFPPTMLFVHPDLEQRTSFWANSYFKPYSHAGPYCIGLLVGYLISTRPDMKLSLPTRIIGWCAAIACNMSVLYGVYEWNSGRDPEMVETLLYSGLHRVAWASGVAWVVVNCVNGQGGVVNYILSWKCWIPLGRLTYAAYLIHPIVQVAGVGSLRMRLQTQHPFAIWMFCGHLLVTYGCSFVASMLVEAPFLSLEKLAFKSFTKEEDVNANRRSTSANGAVRKNSEENHFNPVPVNGVVSHL
ncbi:nose resistant to fluoxetine protein 6-like [Uloborus diversus]|uniref:nose resistant to fluoxetine protein 6-like n=1 Tax=Uloborus diversus TaxID=327109 RepID=UPI00240A8F0C|nr:nose resistant to fluoxetine protein 6-like [Uloborus diversus]